MELTPNGWMSMIAGLIGFFFWPFLFAPIAVAIGLLTWNDGKLGKIGLIIGVIDLLLLVLI